MVGCSQCLRLVPPRWWLSVHRLQVRDISGPVRLLVVGSVVRLGALPIIGAVAGVSPCRPLAPPAEGRHGLRGAMLGVLGWDAAVSLGWAGRGPLAVGRGLHWLRLSATVVEVCLGGCVLR